MKNETTKDQTMNNLYAAALCLNIPNEWLTLRPFGGDCVEIISKSGARWDARTGKTGKIKVSTIRPAQY